jgi:hypothetical protein
MEFFALPLVNRQLFYIFHVVHKVGLDFLQRKAGRKVCYSQDARWVKMVRVSPSVVHGPVIIGNCFTFFM